MKMESQGIQMTPPRQGQPASPGLGSKYSDTQSMCSSLKLSVQTIKQSPEEKLISGVFDCDLFFQTAKEASTELDMTEARIDEFFEIEKVSGIQLANYLRALGLHRETKRFHKEKQASAIKEQK